MPKNLRTTAPNTWCPGCPNHVILESSRVAIENMIKQGFRKEDFAMVSGVGCHAKIFDYLDIGGFYGLHGRTLPTGLGIKLGNPNLHVICYAGDGDCYSEGIAHFIHAGRYNANMTLVVHDNQAFSLTTGQTTAMTQKGYKSKAEPLPKYANPFNPLKMALDTGISFVARCNAKNLQHTAETIEKAVKHKGFAFIEIIQDCIIFNLDINDRDKRMYILEDKKRTKKEALELAEEYDYNLGDGKIALGVFYAEERPTMDDNWPQLTKLLKEKKGWKQSKK